jgi:hypothetical protein
MSSNSVKTLTTAMTLDCLKAINTLDMYRKIAWDELKVTRALIAKGQIGGAPFPYLAGGRPNGGVINTLHAAASALDAWFWRNRECWHLSGVSDARKILEVIMKLADDVVIVTDPYEGEDDSQHYVREWIQIMLLFGVAVRESRVLRSTGHVIAAPDFMIHPPRRLRA